jgi:hypothetical protein
MGTKVFLFKTGSVGHGKTVSMTTGVLSGH